MSLTTRFCGLSDMPVKHPSFAKTSDVALQRACPILCQSHSQGDVFVRHIIILLALLLLTLYNATARTF